MSWSQTREITEKIIVITEEGMVSVYSRKRAKNPRKWELIDSIPVKDKKEGLRIEGFLKNIIEGVRKIK